MIHLHQNGKRKLGSHKCCIHPQCQDRLHEKLMKPAFATIIAMKTHLGVQVADMFHFCYVRLVTAMCTIILTPLVDVHLVELHQNKDKNLFGNVQILHWYHSTSQIRLALR